MAAWVGFIKALELLQRNPTTASRKAMPVPDAVLRRWERFQTQQKVRSKVKEADALRHPAPSMAELVNIVVGDENNK